jgi:hypothetical protein
VGFTVLIPERSLDDADVDVMIEPALLRHGVPEHTRTSPATRSIGTSRPRQMTLRESGAPMPLPDKTEWREVEGIVVAEDPPYGPPTIRVRLEIQGTHVELSSRDLPVRQLLDIGRSLVPLPPFIGRDDPGSGQRIRCVKRAPSLRIRAESTAARKTGPVGVPRSSAQRRETTPVARERKGPAHGPDRGIAAGQRPGPATLPRWGSRGSNPIVRSLRALVPCPGRLAFAPATPGVPAGWPSG